MLVFKERGKPEYPEKSLLEQGREPSTNSTDTWCRCQDMNPGHTGGRRVLSPLCHPLLPELDYEQSPFLFKDSRVSETRVCMKITQCEKGEMQRLSRVGWLSRALAFRLLCYPWAKIRTNRSLPRIRIIKNKNNHYSKNCIRSLNILVKSLSLKFTVIHGPDLTRIQYEVEPLATGVQASLGKWNLRNKSPFTRPLSGEEKNDFKTVVCKFKLLMLILVLPILIMCEIFCTFCYFINYVSGECKLHWPWKSSLVLSRYFVARKKYLMKWCKLPWLIFNQLRQKIITNY